MEETPKHPGGRPTDYKPEYCEMLVEHMKRGLSFEAFGAVVDVCEDTLYEWRKVHPEFSEAYKRGLAHSRNFWEELGLIGTTEGKNFNATTWIFNMKNRFKWKDRHDVTTDDEKLEVVQVVNYGEDNPAAS
jgi:transposase